MRAVASAVVAVALTWTSAEAAHAYDAVNLPQVTQSELDLATVPLDLEIKTLALTLDVSPLIRPGSAGPLTLDSDVLFTFGSASLRPSAIKTVRGLAESWPRGASASVTGHTDSIGSDAANLRLSRERADAVAAVLRAARPDLRLAVEGRGEAEPIASNGTPDADDPQGRAKNRRVELRLNR